MEKRHLYKYDDKKAFNYVLKIDKNNEKNCIKKNLDFDNKFVNLAENHKAYYGVMMFQNEKTQKENRKEAPISKSDNSKGQIARIPTLFKTSNK